jgi:hypothetical protein
MITPQSFAYLSAWMDLEKGRGWPNGKGRQGESLKLSRAVDVIDVEVVKIKQVKNRKRYEE